MLIRGASSVRLQCGNRNCRAFVSIDRMNHVPTNEDAEALLNFAHRRGWHEDLCPKCILREKDGKESKILIV